MQGDCPPEERGAKTPGQTLGVSAIAFTSAASLGINFMLSDDHLAIWNTGKSYWHGFEVPFCSARGV